MAVMQWAREHGCPWDSRNVCTRRSVLAPARAAVGAGAPLPVGLEHVGMDANDGYLEVLNSPFLSQLDRLRSDGF